MRNPRHRLRNIMIISAAAAVIIGAALVIAWLRGAFLPGWVRWNTGEEAYGSALTVTLTNGVINGRKISVSTNDEELVWQSGKGVLVQDYLIADIDHDGAEELLILCWKIGKYGEQVPLFGSGEDNKWHQHIYIYRWKEGQMHAVWMASELGFDVADWRYSDADDLTLIDPTGRESQWCWEDWGLESK